MDKYFELKALAKHLKNHLIDNNKQDAAELIDIVTTHFPEFLVKTRAYRFHRNSGGPFVAKEGNSYSLSVNGAKQFLIHEQFGFKLSEEEELSLVIGQIKGVDLVTLCKHLVFNDFLAAEDVEIFYPEEEVLSFEVIDFKIEPYSR